MARNSKIHHARHAMRPDAGPRHHHFVLRIFDKRSPSKRMIALRRAPSCLFGSLLANERWCWFGLRRRKLVSLGNGQPTLGHFGFAVALRAVHHGSAVSLVALAAGDFAMLRDVRVELHTGRGLDQVIARQVVAALIQAELIALEAARLGIVLELN